MSKTTTRRRTDIGDALAKKLGQCIARNRKANGLTQEDLSERLLIDPKSLARIERGAVLPSLQRLFEMSDALDVPVTQLLGEASPRDSDFMAWLGQRVLRLPDDDRLRVLDLIERLAR